MNDIVARVREILEEMEEPEDRGNSVHGYNDNDPQIGKTPSQVNDKHPSNKSHERIVELVTLQIELEVALERYWKKMPGGRPDKPTHGHTI